MGRKPAARHVAPGGQTIGMRFAKLFLLVGLGAVAASMAAWALWLNSGAASYSRAAVDPRDPSLTLMRTQELIARQYPVLQAEPGAVAARVAAGSIALFDVRTAEEFEKGHIAGAVRVDPGMSPQEFFARYGRVVAGKPSVFYCSVGYRSSKLVARLLPYMKTAHPIGKFNLSGGAFRWVYEGRELVSGHEPGELHPFNAEWGDFLNRLMATSTADQ